MRLLVLLGLLAIPHVARGTDFEPILAKANSKSWRDRWGAVLELARLPNDDDMLRLRGRLLQDNRPRVREAIAWACYFDREMASAVLLGIALRKDPDPAVRRAAARALIHFKDRRAVSALIAALEREQEVRTRLQIVQTLRALTPAPCLLDAAAWRAWWQSNGHDPRFVPADEAARKGAYEGIELETRTVAAIRPSGKRQRTPPHVLVLPGFGFNTALYGPYLLPLRAHASLTWVSLPSAQRLTGRSGYGRDIAKYPVDRLVKALDRFRDSLDLKRFVILAPGAAGWIAMRYAQRYPERCAGLVLIDTALDKRAYADALRRGAARGTSGERFTAKTLLRQNSVPFNRATLDRLHALGLQSGFSDRADLEIGYAYRYAREPQGFATVPELRWGKRARIEAPALFLYSGASAFSGYGDADRIQKHFPHSIVAPIREARGLPFVDSNDQFHAVLADFLKRFKLID